MKILVLGGTHFLGRHITEACLSAGHEVTLFNRGHTNPGLFADDTETITGDRDGDLSELAGHQFDACIDPSGYLPRHVQQSGERLRDVIEHYTFISSISVYPTFTPGQDENAPVATLEDPTTEIVDGATYGGLKALCESAANDALPERVLNVRSGLIVGPYDPTDRFSYWPLRIAQGGRFAAPVGPDVPVQVIDARDQAEWIVRCVADGTTGTYNVTGPQTSLGATFDACIEASGAQAKPVWASEELLLANAFQPWMELPLWLPEKSQGMMQVSTTKAEAQGLACRPLIDTVRDLLAWHPGGTDSLAAGLNPTREAELLALIDRV